LEVKVLLLGVWVQVLGELPNSIKYFGCILVFLFIITAYSSLKESGRYSRRADLFPGDGIHEAGAFAQNAIIASLVDMTVMRTVSGDQTQ
jgi:hypothetical protein